MARYYTYGDIVRVANGMSSMQRQQFMTMLENITEADRETLGQLIARITNHITNATTEELRDEQFSLLGKDSMSVLLWVCEREWNRFR